VVKYPDYVQSQQNGIKIDRLLQPFCKKHDGL
jgi:hypothetical protein